ncbi:MAG: tRNA pseudouridine(38-40) synthase TruA [Candidatus Omnitrophota bacterium]|nr:tRNA pseudouridine(38-40) synthase TruA [Candidatus Omnitrophota bacterium]
MQKLKLTIAYDGTRYAGWQVQQARRRKAGGGRQTTEGRKQQPTIQGTLERVLRRIVQEPVRVVGSGRTDAGVHALAQVAHVTTHARIPCGRLLRSLNQLLPPDLAVTHLEEADTTFHARFSATGKRYRYRLFTGAVVPPFIRPYVHQVRVALDLALMRREAARLLGRHDFRAFARAGGRPTATTRTLSAADLKRRGQEVWVELSGNGFLHTMVRSIVGTLIDVGRGHRPPGTIRRLLTTRQRRLAGPTAPARGLALVEVRYD